MLSLCDIKVRFWGHGIRLNVNWHSKMPKLRGDDMLKWFRERRIAKSVEAVKIFVNENYKESPKTPSGTSSGIRYSRRAEPKFSRSSEPQTKYSYSEEPETKNDETSEVKYSLKTLGLTVIRN